MDSGIPLKMVKKSDLGAIEKADIIKVAKMIKTSVNQESLDFFKKWNSEFGSGE